MKEKEQFEIKMKDDGIGFDPLLHKQDSYGFNNMKERTAEFKYDFSISSLLNQGTEIILKQLPPYNLNTV